MSQQDELFENDPLFAALRAFGANPENSQPDLPMAIGKAFRTAHQNHLRRRKLIRRVLAPTTAITILVPSLAYAHVLPAVISQPVTHVVQVVAHAINRPVVAVRNEISRITASNVAPSILPTPDITVLNTPTAGISTSATNSGAIGAAPQPTFTAAPVMSQRSRDEEVIVAAPITPQALPIAHPSEIRSHEDYKSGQSSSPAPSHRPEVRETHSAEAAPAPESTSAARESHSESGQVNQNNQRETSNPQQPAQNSESTRPEPARTSENNGQPKTIEQSTQPQLEPTNSAEPASSGETKNHG